MAIGLFFVIAALVPDSTGLYWIYDRVMSVPPDDATMTRFGRASTGLMGAVTLGFGDLIRRLGGLALHPEPARLAPAIRGAVLVWFLVDSAFSVAIGAPLNVLGNVGFVALLAGPTWLPTRTPAPTASATAARGGT